MAPLWGSLIPAGIDPNDMASWLPQQPQAAPAPQDAAPSWQDQEAAQDIASGAYQTQRAPFGWADLLRMGKNFVAGPAAAAAGVVTGNPYLVDNYTVPLAKGAVQQLGSMATLPGRVASGEVDPTSDEGIKEATNFGMTAPLGVGLADMGLRAAGKELIPAEEGEGALGMFAGRMAKTANPQKFATAQDMLSRGATPEDIWDATGMFQGRDGAWRFEIPDDKAIPQYTPYPGSSIIKRNVRGGWLKFPALYKAYPSLRNGRVTFNDFGGAPGEARYSPIGDETQIAPPNAAQLAMGPQSDYAIKNTLLHEFQHAIQAKEPDFASGASPSTSSPRIIQMGNTAMKYGQYPPGMTEEDVKNLVRTGMEANTPPDYYEGAAVPQSEMFPEFKPAPALPNYDMADIAAMTQFGRNVGDFEWNTYKNEAGEVEARNVEARSRMTPEQRAAMPPWTTEDVPREQQFVLPQMKPLFANSDKAAPLGLVVARRLPDGSIRYGQPGDTHGNLLSDSEIENTPPGIFDSSAMGFAYPGGSFMSRGEAAQHLGLPSEPGLDSMDLPDRQDEEPFSYPGDALYANAKRAAPLGLAGALNNPTRMASPEDIARAAVESRSMTQQGLRNLYQELGLTGQEPSDFVKPSLAATQPQSVVDEATALKLQDRAALQTLPPEKRALFVRGKPVTVGGEKFKLPSQLLSDAAAQERAPLTKAVKKAEIEYDNNPQAFPRPLFDLSHRTLTQTPDVPQFPLPRLAPNVTDRLQPAFQGGAGLKRLESAASQADPEMWGWYHLQQTRRDFHAEHGPVKGEQMYNAWLDSLAGTSMLNPISNNVRSSSYYLTQLAAGKPLPELVKLTDPTTGKSVSTLAGGPPAGYGAKSEVQHAARVRQFVSNQFDPVKNAKPISYRQNLGGNWMPRTVDTHDIRNMVGMPYAKGAFNDENSALLPGEYTALEDLGQKAATRAGTHQAPQQAGTWIGGGEYTGLKSVPLPVQAELQRRIMVTAKVYGMHPMDVYQSFIRGHMPLLANGMTAAPLSLAGASQPSQQ